MRLGEIGQDAAQRANIGLDAVQPVAHLQGHGRVHDVLRGGSPVNVTSCVAAHLHQLVHQRQDGIADNIGFLAHVIEVDALDTRFACDRLGRFGRNHANAGFGAGKGDLDVDVALYQRTVGEDLSHLPGSESIAEQRGIDDGTGGGNAGVGHGATLLQ